jgi:hypothetical protein
MSAIETCEDIGRFQQADTPNVEPSAAFVISNPVDIISRRLVTKWKVTDYLVMCVCMENQLSQDVPTVLYTVILSHHTRRHSHQDCFSLLESKRNIGTVHVQCI